MCTRLRRTLNMDVNLMHQAAVKRNQDFTAVIKHVAVNLEMMRILIPQQLQREKAAPSQSWRRVEDGFSVILRDPHHKSILLLLFFF